MLSATDREAVVRLEPYMREGYAEGLRGKALVVFAVERVTGVYKELLEGETTRGERARRELVEHLWKVGATEESDAVELALVKL